MGAPASIPEVLITCNACGAELEGDTHQALVEHAEVCPEYLGRRAGPAALAAAPKAQPEPSGALPAPAGSEADRKGAYRVVAELIDVRQMLSPSLAESLPDRPGVVREILRIRDAMLVASRVPLSPSAPAGNSLSGTAVGSFPETSRPCSAASAVADGEGQ